MRPYGWTGNTINDTEAAELRHMAQWITDGTRSSYALLTDLADRGVATVSGKPWTRASIKGALTNPRMIGKKRTPDGELVDTPVEPILDETTWQQVVDTLTSTKRVQFDGTQKIRRTGLLSGGILRCGVCGRQLYGRHPKTKDRRPTYQCNRDGPGCGTISIDLGTADEEVTRRFLARLVDGRMREDLAAALRVSKMDADEKLIARYDDAQRAIGVRFADLAIDAAALEAASKRLAENRAAAEDRIRGRRLVAELPAPTVHAIGAWWTAAPLDVQRAALETLIVKATVGRKVAGVPERITIDWRYWKS